MKDFFKGKKTYIVAILMSLVSLTSVLSGDMSILDFISSQEVAGLLQAFGLAALRSGVSNG